MARQNKKGPYSVKHDWKGEETGEKYEYKGVGRPRKKRYSKDWGGAREGSGRPPLPKGEKAPPTSTITIRVPLSVKAKAEVLRDVHGIPLNRIYIEQVEKLSKALGVMIDESQDS